MRLTQPDFFQTDHPDWYHSWIISKEFNINLKVVKVSIPDSRIFGNFSLFLLHLYCRSASMVGLGFTSHTAFKADCPAAAEHKQEVKSLNLNFS